MSINNCFVSYNLIGLKICLKIEISKKHKNSINLNFLKVSIIRD